MSQVMGMTLWASLPIVMNFWVLVTISLDPWVMQLELNKLSQLQSAYTLQLSFAYETCNIFLVIKKFLSNQCNYLILNNFASLNICFHQLVNFCTEQHFGLPSSETLVQMRFFFIRGRKALLKRPVSARHQIASFASFECRIVHGNGWQHSPLRLVC